jgi:hypothetical protein
MMKTISVYTAIALALARSSASTDAFSIRQVIVTVCSRRGRSGGVIQREAALVDSSSTSAACASPELAFFDEPRLYAQRQQQQVNVMTPAPLLPTSSEISFRLRRSEPWNKERLDPLEIPMRVEPDLAKAKMAMSLEMILGRAAMVASVMLFAGEMTTGQSLPDQLSMIL